MKLIPLTKKIQKIAIFRALQLGDLLVSVPSARALRKAFPHADICLIGLPWARSFTERFSHIYNRHIAFPGFPGLPEQSYTHSDVLSFLQVIQREKFDLVLQMQGNGTIVNPLVMLFGAKTTAGFYPDDAVTPQLDISLLYPEHLHEVHRHLALMEYMGISGISAELEFPLLPDEKQIFETVCAPYGLLRRKYMCIHPGARDMRRRWSPENFAKVADYFANRGYRIVLTGSNDEKPVTDRIQRLMHKQCINMAGQTAVGVLGFLIKHASLLITNDTAPSHIAAALETPSVVLFTPFSEIHRWAPLDTGIHRSIRTHTIASIYPVLEEARSLLDEKTDVYSSHFMKGDGIWHLS